MKFCFLLIGFIFSFGLYGGVPRPCEKVGFDQIIEHFVSSDGQMFVLYASSQGEYKLMKQFKKCIRSAAVCLIAFDVSSKNWSKGKNWINEQLIPPVNDNFDQVKGLLILGMLQYVDKKSGAGVCIVAKNNLAKAIPWYGRSWVVTDHDIKEYEIYGSQFHVSMTPNSLYEAMLDIHNEEVWMSEHRRK
ncbi:hypothetical protein [Legionella worsleiensis]|uniref:Uncharacterized protein n=1 Tax=Legionella worsleiensis TaxID=45076 RepID=A0A0W1AK92_9GAMM|nr:hypothetical protein [Legionella worsleiensis]KTD81771.1 hypothetical protein Lwor_0074 [Legionella worsleiensis]STY31156.1 Uncharacterised protein [Legionella worsleiensis]